jgi:tyrosine-protein kinase Etk/Wzc
MLAHVSSGGTVVLVDTPPVLTVTDSALVARHATVNLLVLHSGRHTLHEIELAVDRLGDGGADVTGAVLNGDRGTNRRYGRYDYYYRYEQPSSSSDADG